MVKNHPLVRFSVIGINHDHIYGMVHALVEAGAELALKAQAQAARLGSLANDPI